MWIGYLGLLLGIRLDILDRWRSQGSSVSIRIEKMRARRAERSVSNPALARTVKTIAQVIRIFELLEIFGKRDVSSIKLYTTKNP